MSTRKRKPSIASRIQSPRNSQDDSTELENSQGTKSRAKNYSAEESAALIRICDKYHVIINKNSSSDKDKQQKQKAWQSVKTEFDIYCRAEAIYVSLNFFQH